MDDARHKYQITINPKFYNRIYDQNVLSMLAHAYKQILQITNAIQFSHM